MSTVPCGSCGQPVPFCDICRKGKFHDGMMHWSPNGKVTACGKNTGEQIPHYIINRTAFIEGAGAITCSVCKGAR